VDVAKGTKGAASGEVALESLAGTGVRLTSAGGTSCSQSLEQCNPVTIREENIGKTLQ